MIPTKEEMIKALEEKQGKELQKRFSKAVVAVCGLGGLGSNISVSLARAGIAEFDKEIESSDIKFCIDASKEMFFPADSRKMSRVVNNLISNILKYSMKNTRAFISAKETDNQIVLEFKNTSAYPLDFDAKEIMGRFVRGDESRTTEGNGLGLAIAKSYTELCNGTLDIVLDGDLFKAVIRFKKY